MLPMVLQVRAADQVINLQPGWNSVFLEVQPTNADPAAVFAGKPVVQVAVWQPTQAKVESLTDPRAVPSKSTEWLQWQPAGRPAAFLNNLRALKARTALLVKATAAATVTVSGDAVYERRKWVAPSFNFTGFDVDPAAPASFARFFDGSRAHLGSGPGQGLKVFKLVNQKWRAVTASEPIQRGVGYWVWCGEGSDHQGPVDVTVNVDASGCVVLENGGAPARMQFRANGSLPVTLTATAGGSLPLLQASGTPEAAFSGTLNLPLRSDTGRTFSLRRVTDAAPDSAAGMVTLIGGGMKLLLPVRGN